MIPEVCLPPVPKDGPATAGPAFRALYDEHRGFVSRVLRRFGLSGASLDDALQDVFIVVFRRLDEYDGQRPFRSWVWGIARRVASTHTRSERRAFRRQTAEQAPRPATSTPDRDLAVREAVTLIDGFLAKLAPEQREVFILSEIESWAAADIADALSIPIGTVYSRLHHARGRFAELNERWQRRQVGES